MQEVFRLTPGIRTLVWGYQAWNHAVASPIGAEMIRETSELVSQRLDKNFFSVGFGRMTRREKT